MHFVIDAIGQKNCHCLLPSRCLRCPDQMLIPENAENNLIAGRWLRSSLKLTLSLQEHESLDVHGEAGGYIFLSIINHKVMLL